jgi:hypothetical protein
MNTGGKINPDVIKNVQKYIDWMPEQLNYEISSEIQGTPSAGWNPQNLQESLAYLIAALSRKPTTSSRAQQTEWVRGIIKDLRITPEAPQKNTWVNLSDFISSDKSWSEYNRGWNGGMWASLLSAISEYEESDFLDMEQRRRMAYGKTLRELIFSERLSNFNFINWVNENPLEVKQ